MVWDCLVFVLFFLFVWTMLFSLWYFIQNCTRKSCIWNVKLLQCCSMELVWPKRRIAENGCSSDKFTRSTGIHFMNNASWNLSQAFGFFKDFFFFFFFIIGVVLKGYIIVSLLSKFWLNGKSLNPRRGKDLWTHDLLDWCWRAIEPLLFVSFCFIGRQLKWHSMVSRF